MFGKMLVPLDFYYAVPDGHLAMLLRRRLLSMQPTILLPNIIRCMPLSDKEMLSDKR